GMRIVIEVKRDAVGEVVLNNLYSQTQLQVSFGINMVALHHGQMRGNAVSGRRWRRATDATRF
ncbi:hypothetical protein MJM59_28300, partial [Salmonella enterica subsp. enterica serovar Montevideo]|nr:hypothetical protein [Salmonella enterica subsp. enterica serovar Montevideo]